MVSYRRHLSSRRTSTAIKSFHYIEPVTRSFEHLIDSEVVMADVPLFPDNNPAPRQTPKLPHSVSAYEQAVAGIPPRVAERLANTGTHSTPRRGDIGTESDHQSGSAAKATNDAQCQTFEQWAKYHKAFDSSESGGTIECFLDKYVPSNAPALSTIAGLVEALHLSATEVPMAGTEKLTCAPIVTLLTRCQQDFPASNTIAFQDTHARYLTGPTEYDHTTHPI